MRRLGIARTDSKFTFLKRLKVRYNAFKRGLPVKTEMALERARRLEPRSKEFMREVELIKERGTAGQMAALLFLDEEGKTPERAMEGYRDPVPTEGDYRRDLARRFNEKGTKQMKWWRSSLRALKASMFFGTFFHSMIAGAMSIAIPEIMLTVTLPLLFISLISWKYLDKTMSANEEIDAATFYARVMMHGNLPLDVKAEVVELLKTSPMQVRNVLGAMDDNDPIRELIQPSPLPRLTS